MFGLSTLQLGSAALVAAFLLVGAAYWKGRSDGRTMGVVSALQSEIDQRRERDETDAEIDQMDRYQLCVDELGSVPDCDRFR